MIQASMAPDVSELLAKLLLRNVVSRFGIDTAIAGDLFFEPRIGLQ
jgi:hypothetical protein